MMVYKNTRRAVGTYNCIFEFRHRFRFLKLGFVFMYINARIR